MSLNKKFFKKIVIAAAYGRGNIGDEAICESIVNDIISIGRDAKIKILVFDKDLFFRAHPQWIKKENIKTEIMNYRKKIFINPKHIFSAARGFIDILFCDFFIWGGGGIIRNRPDWLKIYIIPLRIAQFFNKKILILSIGVDEITDNRVIKLMKKIRKVDFFSVRDENSKQNILNAVKLFKQDKIKIIRDPVFHSLCNLPLRSNQKIRIGINLSYWKAFFNEQTDIFAEKIAKTLNDIYKNIDFEIIYLPTSQDKDSIVFNKFKEHLNKDIKIIIPIINTPDEFLLNASDCKLIIAMRMHSIILSSLINALPIFIIIYDEKVNTLTKELNLNKNNIFTISEVNSGEYLLRESLIDCLKNPDNYHMDFAKARSSSIELIDILRQKLL